MATAGNLAMTGISYTSAMSTIVGQRASISAMWKRVDELLNSAAMAGRKLSASPKDDPVAKGNTFYLYAALCSALFDYSVKFRIRLKA